MTVSPGGWRERPSQDRTSHGKRVQERHGQSFYAHGKLLLSSEYLVMDGALALALPTRLGQYLKVQYQKSYTPLLYWKGIDVHGRNWFETTFELWKFDLIRQSHPPTSKELLLQKLLRAARRENRHFLRDEETAIQVTTRLEFPLEWGLGSSSTLIYNMARWAQISPFKLQSKTVGGSGYDIACAEASGPILYENGRRGVLWNPIPFRPPFSHQLYFVYLGKKQKTDQAIHYYRQAKIKKSQLAIKLSDITRKLYQAKTLSDFEFLLNVHENLISQNLGLPRIQESHFSDYWGTVKSLGAWGGDFVLATSERGERETRRYFGQKGLAHCFTYHEMIRGSGNGEKEYGPLQ